MEPDKWVIARTEEVMAHVLRLTNQPEDILFSVMAEAIGYHPGLLHFAGSLEIFESVEFDETTLKEAEDLIEEFRLLSEEPLGDLSEIASKTIVQWCCFYIEYAGLILIANEGAGLRNLGGTIVFRESTEDGEPSEEA